MLRWGAAISLAVAVVGCSDLDDFSTRQDEVWRGRIVQADFVRRGFDELPTLELGPLDLSNATSAPGRITTSDGTFDHAALLPIAALPHDALGGLEFGVGRLRNYMFMVNVSAGPRQDQQALAVLSLLDDDSIELRIILGTGARAEAGDLYGVFPLTKQKSDE
jgi:hypothetical protein